MTDLERADLAVDLCDWFRARKIAKGEAMAVMAIALAAIVRSGHRGEEIERAFVEMITAQVAQSMARMGDAAS